MLTSTPRTSRTTLLYKEIKANIITVTVYDVFKCSYKLTYVFNHTISIGNQRRATSEEISPGLRRKEIDIESTYEQLDKSKNEIRLYTSIENIRTGFRNKDYVK
jgi:hypothetical protein